MDTNEDMIWLFKWFFEQCDGDWEHGKGVKIGTLSNPGWYIKIDLEETFLEEREFKKQFIERSEHDWLFCNKENNVFIGDCGPFNLPEVIKVFRTWAELNQRE